MSRTANQCPAGRVRWVTREAGLSRFDTTGRADGVLARQVIHIVQVGKAIGIEVRNQTTRRPARVRRTHHRSDIQEGAVALIVVQLVLPEIRNVQIDEPVVVEIARRDSLSKISIRETGSVVL